MSLFQNLQQNNQQNDINTLYQQFRQNPMEFLAKSNLRIPSNMTNPVQILQFLNQNGKIPQQLQGQANQFLRK